MFVSPTPPRAVDLSQISMVPQAAADLSATWEDGCTIRRPALRLSDPGLWCTVVILMAATGWLMG